MQKQKPVVAAAAAKMDFLPTLQFYMYFHWIAMEMVGLHVYGMLDANILLVLDHCDCSKTAFRLQKMLCYAKQQEGKNKRAFPSHMTVFLLLEVLYSRSYFNAQLLCGMKYRFNMSCVDDDMSLETMVFLFLNALSLLLTISRRFFKPVSEREADHKNLSCSRTLKQRAIHLSISGVIQSWQLQL